MTTPSQYTFFPWARQGLIATLPGPQGLDQALPKRATLPVALKVSQHALNDIQIKDLHLYGPGDLTGIDERVIVRVDPKPHEANFKPNDMPLIEFSRPDFPWLFTPGAPDQQNRLRPWLGLICVEKQSGVTLTTNTNNPLPVLEIKPGQETPNLKAGQELPNPAEAWAWAHVLVTGEFKAGDTLAGVYADHPERVVSRILCPRNLEPDKTYLACLVPLFEAGRQAGLGKTDLPSGEDGDSENQTLSYAWDADTSQIRLPVYHHWEFSTGFEGDFESLARLLEPRPVPAEVGTRLMDLSDPGFQIPTVPVRFGSPGDGGTGVLDFIDLPVRVPGLRIPVVRAMRLEGALRRPTPPGGQTRENNPRRLADRLEQLLNTPARMAQSGPVVGPPIYGRYHANVTAVPAAGGPHPWLRTLNLDLRHRAAAGFGVYIVRDQQEQFMASAWNQVGQIRRVNQILSQAQLSRQTAGVVYQKTFQALAGSKLSEMQDGFLELTGPVHARVKLPVAGQTVREQLAGTTLPPAAVSAPFRRIARPRGPIIRRVLAGHSRPAQALQTLAKGIIAPVPPLNRPPTNGQLPNGTQVLDPVPAATPPWHSRYPKIVESDRSPAALADTRLAEDPDAARRFRRAAEDKLGELANRQPPGPPPQPDLGDVWHQLLYQLHPERSIPNRVRNRLQVPPGLQWSEDELEPIMAAPEFDQAMYRPLKQISQDLLLPGLRYVPANTLSLVETNPQFIESYMVGLNHEMSAELLWREYPSDQRGSYFRQFWDLKGSVPDGNAPDRDQPDLAPIHTWGRSGDNGLGEHLIRGQGSSGGPPGMAVLIVRGELLRLYPNTMIYAVQGMWESDEDKRRPDPNSPEKYPIFRGKLDPDATFLGFDLDISQIRGSTNKSDGRPGWFFIIEGPPTEPRFGLDELLDFSDNNVGQDPDTWHAISWGDLIRPQGSEQANEKALAQMAYAPVDPPASSKYRSPDLKGRGSTPAPDSETYWGFNAAHMAYITLQLPVRLAIHADDMLPS